MKSLKLEQAIKEKPSLEALLANTLAEKRAKFQAASAPALGLLSWQEAQNKLLTNDSFHTLAVTATARPDVRLE